METMFRYDETVENELNKVKKMLHLSMNGVVSENMSALDYKLNYGVLLPRIKELALEVDKSFPLAQRMWFSNCREMMMMATMVCPVESMDQTTALKWASSCHNMELVEQLCLNLFRKLHFANQLISVLLADKAPFVKAAGYVLATFLLRGDSLTADAKALLEEALKEDVYAADYAVYASVARYLRVRAENAPEEVVAFLEQLDDAKGEGVAWVKENVKTILMY